jgi:hypothetical protein
VVLLVVVLLVVVLLVVVLLVVVLLVNPRQQLVLQQAVLRPVVLEVAKPMEVGTEEMVVESEVQRVLVVVEVVLQATTVATGSSPHHVVQAK